MCIKRVWHAQERQTLFPIVWLLVSALYLHEPWPRHRQTQKRGSHFQDYPSPLGDDDATPPPVVALAQLPPLKKPRTQRNTEEQDAAWDEDDGFTDKAPASPITAASDIEVSPIAPVSTQKGRRGRKAGHQDEQQRPEDLSVLVPLSYS